MAALDIAKRIAARERHGIVEQLRARRDALAEQHTYGRVEYDNLEERLKQLGRSLDMTTGRIRELDALLEQLEPHSPT